MREDFNRRDFISKIFGATVMSMLAPVALGTLIPSLKANADTLSGIFSLKLSDYPALGTDGGIVWVSIPNMPAPNTNRKVIVFRKSATEFFAYSERCTHQSCNCGQTNYNATTKSHVCPCHQSEFSSEGKVTKGPASSNLSPFTATYDAASQRVNIEIPNLLTGVYDNSEAVNYVSQVIVTTNTISVECKFSKPCRAEFVILSVDGKEISKLEIDYTHENELKRAKLYKPNASGLYLLAIRTSIGIDDIRKFVV